MPHQQSSLMDVVNFKAKYLTYVPRECHHFITSKLLPSTNVCEVTKERALLNKAILQDIKFDVGKIIKDAILSNKEGRISIGYSILIYQLCRKPRVEVSSKEDSLHVIKAIVVRKKKGALEQQG